MPKYSITNYNISYHQQSHKGRLLLNLDNDKEPEVTLYLTAEEVVAVLSIINTSTNPYWDSDEGIICNAK